MSIREKLAALEHTQWAHWTTYMLGVLFPFLFDGSQAEYPHPDVKRWMGQIMTPYAELSEKEKDSDREWADKVLLQMVGRVVVMEGSEAHHQLKMAGFSQTDEWDNNCNLVIMEW